MLPASARLRKSSEISETMRFGKKYSSRLVVLHVRTQPNTPIRVAFSVGKAVGNSVVRHQTSRRLRHIMINELSRFQPGTDVVVRALPQAGSASYADLLESVDYAVNKAVNKAAAL